MEQSVHIYRLTHTESREIRDNYVPYPKIYDWKLLLGASTRYKGYAGRRYGKVV